MPVLVNPYLSFGTSPPGGIVEPWGEVARQTSISSGKLTISGLDLTGVQVLRVHVSGVAVTTDDTQVSLRFLITGSEVATGYRWAVLRIATGLADAVGSNSATGMVLSSSSTRGVGNAAAEGLGATVTIYDPASSSLYKRCYYHSTYLKPDGTLMELAAGAGALDNTGAITGVAVVGDSDLTAGSIIVLGVV